MLGTSRTARPVPHVDRGSPEHMCEAWRGLAEPAGACCATCSTGALRTLRPPPEAEQLLPHWIAVLLLLQKVETCELEKSSALASLQNKVSEMWCSSSMGALKWHHHQRGHGGPPPEAEQLLPHWIECSCFCRRWKSCELERAVLCASLQETGH